MRPNCTNNRLIDILTGVLYGKIMQLSLAAEFSYSRHLRIDRHLFVRIHLCTIDYRKHIYELYQHRCVRRIHHSDTIHGVS